MSESTELTVIDEDVSPRAELSAPSPMAMIHLAVQRGASIEQMKQLMDLQERWDAQQARKAFTAAMAAFKANPPEIIKEKQVSFPTAKGKTEYKHATLGNVCAAIIEGLAAHGISHRWKPEQNGTTIKITCILTHSQGHSEDASMESKVDDSGGKNAIQAIASAKTYLERYTLLAVTGLATKDQADDDGKSAEDRPPVGTEAADPNINQAPPVVVWPELLPNDWKAAQNPKNPAETLGDLAVAPGGEVALKALWWQNQASPALNAWASTWITASLRELDIDWLAVVDAIAGMPDAIEDAKPAQLITVAKWIGPQLTAKAKIENAA